MHCLEKKYDSNNESENDSEWVNVLISNKCTMNNAKQAICVMTVGNRIVKFQIDTGSTTSIIPVNIATNVRTTNITLMTWNNDNYKPSGESRQIIKNPKTTKKIYSVNFSVHNHFTPILGVRAMQR